VLDAAQFYVCKRLRIRVTQNISRDLLWVYKDKSRHLENRSIISQRQHCRDARVPLLFSRIIARCRTRRHIIAYIHAEDIIFVWQAIINNARNNLERSVDDVEDNMRGKKKNPPEEFEIGRVRYEQIHPFDRNAARYI